MDAETANLKQVIRFLREHLYADVPPQLFDRYLWLYRDVEDAQHHTIYGRRQDRLRFVQTNSGGALTGVAAAERLRRRLVIKAHATDDDALRGLVIALSSGRRAVTLQMTLANEAMATTAASLLGGVLTSGPVKYYTSSPCPNSGPPIREMFASDESYLEQLRPRRWPAFRQFLKSGTRFFGLILEGQLKAMCGLAQLTAFQSQIIGVETFDLSERRKGYGKTVSAFALREGLDEAPIVTWSTSQQNTASCRTAESMGMRPYFALWTVEGKPKAEGT